MSLTKPPNVKHETQLMKYAAQNKKKTSLDVAHLQMQGPQEGKG